jgi:hypothetical protein
LARSRKHWRQTFMPYLRIRPPWLEHTRLREGGGGWGGVRPGRPGGVTGQGRGEGRGAMSAGPIRGRGPPYSPPLRTTASGLCQSSMGGCSTRRRSPFCGQMDIGKVRERLRPAPCGPDRCPGWNPGYPGLSRGAKGAREGRHGGIRVIHGRPRACQPSLTCFNHSRSFKRGMEMRGREKRERGAGGEHFEGGGLSFFGKKGRSDLLSYRRVLRTS